MLKHLIFASLLIFSNSYAEEYETINHDLSPFSIDVILNWDKPDQFPYERHFVWEGNSYETNRNLNWPMMRKRPVKTNSHDLQLGILKICRTLGYEAPPENVRITGLNWDKNNQIVETAGEAFFFKASLKLPKRIHHFIKSLNSILKDVGIDTPDVNLRLTTLSMPVKLVRDYGLDFLPGNKNNTPSNLTNKEFSKLILELTQFKDCEIIQNTMIPTISGKTTVINNTYSINSPEYFDWDGPRTETVEYGDNEKKIVSTELLKAENIEIVWGEPIAIGSIIEVTPTVEPDNMTVSLDIIPQLKALCGWTIYDEKYDLKLPVIKAQSFETRLTLLKGQTKNLGCLYDKKFLNSAAQLVRKEELAELAEEKCFVYFMSVHDDRKIDDALLEEKSLSIMVTPVGDRCNKQLLHLFEKRKINEGVKGLLKEQGVNLIEGAPFYYDSNLSVLFMLNTAEEISKTEKILKVINTDSKKINDADFSELKYSFIELETTNKVIKEIKISPYQKFLNKTKLNKLLRSPKVKISNIGSGLTQSGNTSIIRNVIEGYLPETYEYKKIDGKIVTLPIIGDPTDFGGIFEITPQVDPNGSTIELDLKPKITEMHSWHEQELTKGIPFIKWFDLDTRLKMQRGEIVILSTGKEVKNVFKKNYDDEKIKLLLFYCNLQSEEN